MYPVMNMESSKECAVGARRRVIRPRRDEHVDRVFSPLVHERSHRPPVHVVETASRQWKPDGGEIHDGWSEIELAEKPRLDGVLIGGRDIEQVIGHHRSHMTVDD